MIKSRETTNQALDFEFTLPDDKILYKSTVWVSHIFVSFSPSPNSGHVNAIFADDDGENRITHIEVMNRPTVSFQPEIAIPVVRGSKRIVRFANQQNVETTCRFLWQI